MTSQTLKIMQLGPTLYQGGVAVAIKNLSRELKQLGHDVMLVGNGGSDLEELVQLGVRYQEVNWSQKLLTLLQCVAQIRQLIRQFQPNIIHVHGRGASLACVLAGRKPDFFTLHNSKLTDQVGRFDVGFIRRLLSPFGHRIQVLNPEAIAYLKQEFGISPDRIVQLGHGVDCDHFRMPSVEERQMARARFSIEEGQKLALFVGRLHEQKQPEVIPAFAEVLKQEGLHHIKIAMVGDGPLEDSLRQQIHQTGVETNCVLYGWMNPLQAYWAADLVLMPSLYEGFGFVAVESLACGCPVYRTPTGGHEQTTVEGVTGFLSPGTDSQLFIKKGVEILREAEKLEMMRLSARQWAVEQLSSQHQAKQMLSAYYSYLEE